MKLTEQIRKGFLFIGKALSSVSAAAINGAHGGWYPIIKESFAGAWQRNITLRGDSVLSFHAIFGCITLIASDISKMRVKYVKRDSHGIWQEVKMPDRIRKILRNPNGYQNMIQFIENWMNSKLSRGNTYVLKRRDAQGKINGLFVLSPDLVSVLVSETGDVYYQLGTDNLTDVEKGGIVVPASEIGHDRFNCLFHPLVGLSPIFACGLAAAQGLGIMNNSQKFFENMSRPGGILSAPGAISPETAERLKKSWEDNYSGNNMGKIAVAGDDLKYIPLTMTAEESQLVDQLKMTAEVCCAAYHVPKHKVVGDPPSYNNIESLDTQYYTQCLQALIEAFEFLMDEIMEFEDGEGIELDLDSLLRMDTKTQMETLSEGVKGKMLTPNEARMKLSKAPLKGGDDIYLQMQDFPMATLSKRKSPDDSKTSSTPSATASDDIAAQGSKLLDSFSRHLNG